MGYPKSIKKLIDCFKKIPGVGEKSAERYALAILNFDDETSEAFSKSICEVKEKIKSCIVCHNLSEEDKCEICLDKTRDNTIICVVEEPKNVILFEKLGIYNGLYHVLGGLISPLEGKTPEDINISSLIKRVKEGKINEIIIAIKPGIEGETTSLYLQKILGKENVKISKIAYGIPIGADMEYLDSMTLEMALSDRKEIEKK